MQLKTLTAAVAASILAFAGESHAFWRMECRSSAGIARLDPLVNPGGPANHAHSVFGSNGFSAVSEYAELISGTCTSCSVTEDKSAYWHPLLYFMGANGDFKPVTQAGGMLAYYFLYPNPGDTKVKGFPAGFQMIAGDSNLRNFSLPVPDPDKSEWSSDPAQSSQAALQQKAVGFNCLNYQKNPEGSLYRHTMPTKAYMDANCADGVRFELMFPSCWNGKDISSKNHKDHVAYPDLVMTGTCPPGFETRLAGLFYEVIYNTQEFAGQDGQFILSNGDPTGCGYHGDFISGWDEKFLQDAVDTCTNPSGKIQDCPLFTLQDAATYSTCKFDIPNIIKADNYLSPGSSLPGNVQIVGSGGVVAPGGGAPSTVPAAAPTLSYSPGSVVPSSSPYMPGGIFVASAVTSAAASSPNINAVSVTIATTSTPESTTAPPPPPPPPSTTAAPTTTPLPPGVSIVSTMYTTMGNEVLELVYVEEEITVTEDVTATQSVTVTVPYRQKRQHRHRHVHGHS